jgi:hypothetical protein
MVTSHFLQSGVATINLVAFVCGFDDYNGVNANYNVPKMQKTFFSHIVHFPSYCFQAVELLGSRVIKIH